MRVEGNFTKAFSEIDLGDTVYVQGPFGEFVTDAQYDSNVVLLAGGIGVTPFISMLRHATETKSPIRFTLLYSNRSQRDIPFYEELISLEQANPNLRIIFFMSDGQVMPTTDVTLRAGKIDEPILQRLTGGQFRGITYFLCGPKAFMRDLEVILLRNNVRSDRIISESFAQSSKLFSNRSPVQSMTYAFAGIAMLVAIGGIGLLDLVRAVPKLVSAQSTATTTTNTAATNATTSSPSSSQTSASNTSSSTSTPSSSTTPTTTTTQNYSYSAPTSSVS